MQEEAAANAAHREEASRQLSPFGRKMFKYIEFDKDEVLLAELRKHPIGLVATAAVGLFISLSVFVGSLLLAANLESLGLDGSGALRSIIIFAGLILSLLVLGMTGISLALYGRNVVFVTNDKIAEVTYRSLFNRKTTQLSMGQLEDVTVLQRGIFPRVFDYGTIIIETAGELETCIFTMVPTPHKFSHIIIEAHEDNVHKYGN